MSGDMQGLEILLDRYEWLTVAIDFFVFALLMALMGRLTGVMSGVQSRDELSVRDNPAFGISFAGAVLALALIMTGAVSGEPSISLLHEAMIVAAYGVLGIVLMLSSRLFFDRVALPLINLREQIVTGNVTAAVIDAANLLSTAIVIRAVMIWVDNESLAGLFVVLLAFLFSQLVMILVTRYRQWVYRRRHAGTRLQDAFREGNLAIGLRYFGHRLGAALAITAASGMVAYDEGRLILSAGSWALVSLLMVIVVSLVAIAARFLIMPRIDIAAEVGRQRNLGVGLVEGVIYLAIGLIMAALFALPTE